MRCVSEEAFWIARGRLPLTRRCFLGAGDSAQTRVEVLRRFKKAGAPFALVRALPLTGRMHQIRVHLAHTGHPLVGDKIYGPDENCYLQFIKTGWTPELESKLLLRRHALHSAELEAQELGWQAPLAPDLAEFMSGC